MYSTYLTAYLSTSSHAICLTTICRSILCYSSLHFYHHNLLDRHHIITATIAISSSSSSSSVVVVVVDFKQRISFFKTTPQSGDHRTSMPSHLLSICQPRVTSHRIEARDITIHHHVPSDTIILNQPHYVRLRHAVMSNHPSCNYVLSHQTTSLQYHTRSCWIYTTWLRGTTSDCQARKSPLFSPNQAVRTLAINILLVSQRPRVPGDALINHTTVNHPHETKPFLHLCALAGGVGTGVFHMHVHAPRIRIWPPNKNDKT